MPGVRCLPMNADSAAAVACEIDSIAVNICVGLPGWTDWFRSSVSSAIGCVILKPNRLVPTGSWTVTLPMASVVLVSNGRSTSVSWNTVTIAPDRSVAGVWKSRTVVLSATAVVVA